MTDICDKLNSDVFTFFSFRRVIIWINLFGHIGVRLIHSSGFATNWAKVWFSLFRCTKHRFLEVSRIFSRVLVQILVTTSADIRTLLHKTHGNVKLSQNAVPVQGFAHSLKLYKPRQNFRITSKFYTDNSQRLCANVQNVAARLRGARNFCTILLINFLFHVTKWPFHLFRQYLCPRDIQK